MHALGQWRCGRYKVPFRADLGCLSLKPVACANAGDQDDDGSLTAHEHPYGSPCPDTDADNMEQHLNVTTMQPLERQPSLPSRPRMHRGDHASETRGGLKAWLRYSSSLLLALSTMLQSTYESHAAVALEDTDAPMGTVMFSSDSV